MSTEADLYLRKAEEKLETARRLLEMGRYEDAVSRAYYAVLNAARGALARENIFPKTHEGTLKEFGERLIKGRGMPTRLGTAFSKMKSLREAADYSPHVATSRADAEWCVEAASDFIQEVKARAKARGADY